jgi:RNA polymerase sigma factor (sigma-70 family)
LIRQTLAAGSTCSAMADPDGSETTETAAGVEKSIPPAELLKLVESHYRSIYAFAYHLCGNMADAEDVTQEAYRRFAHRGHTMRDRSLAKTWLFTTARRVALDLLRRAQRWSDSDEAVELAEAETAMARTGRETSDTSSVLQAMQALPERYRSVLLLFYVEDNTYEEIANILSIPIGTVMSRLSRGRRVLAERLGVSLSET